MKILIFLVELWGDGASMFIATFKENRPQKLRIIILLRFGLLEHPSFSWFSDLSDVAMTPKTNMIYLWRHQETPNVAREIGNSFPTNNMLGNLKFRNSTTLNMSKQKTWTANPEDPFNIVLRMLNMASRYSRKYEIDIL